jgi:hypothetical protein
VWKAVRRPYTLLIEGGDRQVTQVRKKSRHCCPGK